MRAGAKRGAGMPTQKQLRVCAVPDRGVKRGGRRGRAGAPAAQRGAESGGRAAAQQGGVGRGQREVATDGRHSEVWHAGSGDKGAAAEGGQQRRR
eukprot:2504738-Prymnesium_polylepis.1